MPRRSGDIETDIAQVLNDCQKTFAAHRRGLGTLKQLFSDQPERFLAIYIGFLNRILLVWKREPNVERLVQLTVSFAKDHLPFAIAIMSHLLEHTGAKDRAIRFRSCQIIAAIIGALPEDAELEDEMWETVSKRMLVRLKDKFPLVRIQAVYALRRLQDPSNTEDPVITDLLHLLNCDANKDVRRAVLTSIGVFKSTLPAILVRTRDVKEDVRKTAFTIISEKLSVKQLAITQRVTLLQDGLEDRDDGVRDVCQQLLGTVWFNALGADPLKLLAALDVEVAESACEKAIKELLRQRPELAPTKPPTIADITKEGAFFFRVACDWFSEQKDLDALEALLPSTAEWCTAVRAYILNEEQEADDFVVRQLVLVLPHLDAQEEVGRQTLLAFLRQFLPSPVVGCEVVPVLCKTLARVCGTEDETLQCAVELLADMREPLDDMEKGEAKAKLDARKEALVAALEGIKVLETTKRQWLRREEKAGKLAALNEELDKIKAEAAEMQSTMRLHEEFSNALRVRCLIMSEHLLASTTKSVTHGIIAGLRESTLLPGIRHPSPEVRLRAATGLGLFALLDPAAARTDGLLLVQVARNDTEAIREVALKALLDVALLHGPKVWTAPGKEEEPPLQSELGAKVFDCFLSALEEDAPLIKTAAAEGIAKMLLVDALSDVDLFARLVALFFSPDTAELQHLRQCLSVFFPTYVVNPVHKTVVQQCFLPLVKAVLASSRQSPLRRLPLPNVFPFLMSLVPPSEKPSEEERAATGTLAVDLARVVLANPQGAEVKAVLKCLRQVGVQKEDQVTVKRLRCLVDEAERYVKDKLTLRALNQYAAELKAMDATPDAELDGDEALDLISKAKQLAAANITAAAPEVAAPSRGTAVKPAAKRARKQAANPKAKEKARKASESGEDSPSDVESASASESEEEEEERVAKIKKKGAAKSKFATSETSSEDERESEQEEGDDSDAEKEVIRVKKTTARSKAAAVQPKRPAAKAEIDSEEEPQPKKVATQESDDDEAEAKEKQAAPAPAPAQQRVFLPKAAAGPKRPVESAQRLQETKRAALPTPARKGALTDSEEDEAEAEVQRPAVAPKQQPIPQQPASKPAAARPVAVAPSTAATRPAPPAPQLQRASMAPKSAAVPKPATAAAPRPEVVPPVRSAIPKTGVPATAAAATAARVHASVKPAVPRLEAKRPAVAAANPATAPLRPLQRPVQQQQAPVARKKEELVRKMQAQIKEMLSSDEEGENAPAAKQHAVRAVLQQVEDMLSD